MEKEKLYFLYETRNILNGMIYIGVHATKDLNDGYMGSGLMLQRAINKHGIENFKRSIIKFFDNSKQMFEEERITVDLDFISRDDVYNLAVGGNGGFRGKEASEKQSKKMKGRKDSDETRLKKSKNRKGKKLSDSFKEALKIGAQKRSYRIKNGELLSSITNKIKVNKNSIIKYVTIEELESFIKDGWEKGLPEELKIKCGHVVTEEQKIKQSETMLRHYETHDGPNKGREFSAEWKENLSKSQTGKKRSIASIEKRVAKIKGVPLKEEHKTKISVANTGKKWKYKLFTINKDGSEKRVPESDLNIFLSVGWVKGRGSKLKESLHSQKGTKCYVNKDNKNKCIQTIDLNKHLLEGFTVGKYKK